MVLIDSLTTWLGRRLAEFLNGRAGSYRSFAVTDTDVLRRVLRPADVLLVEGDRRISIAIKYLTQSSWSHACLYVGDALADGSDADSPALIEADICDGVVAIPLSHYAGLNTRICRPIGLSEADAARVVEYAVSRLGDTYDMKNVIDLVRYLLPEPPIPIHYRRRMLALGSGDPTRAICSTLVAQAFQSIRYPILPRRQEQRDGHGDGLQDEEILRVRHYSHFTPRDFDLSPYFQVLKPQLDADFDFHKLKWSPDGNGGRPARLPEAVDSEVLGIGQMPTP